MAYVKTTWVNTATDLDQTNLNHLETQYDEAVSYASTLAAAVIPAGVIVMWSGLIANIPTGWHLCDGTGGTPNLLAKFVEGVATAATNPGATGGATSKTTVGHTHTQPTHIHTPGGDTAPAGTGGAAVAGWKIAGDLIRANTAAGGDDTTGSSTDTIADIRPLFYDIAFIIKL